MTFNKHILGIASVVFMIAAPLPVMSDIFVPEAHAAGSNKPKAEAKKKRKANKKQLKRLRKEIKNVDAKVTKANTEYLRAKALSDSSLGPQSSPLNINLREKTNALNEARTVSLNLKRSRDSILKGQHAPKLTLYQKSKNLLLRNKTNRMELLKDPMPVGSFLGPIAGLPGLNNNNSANPEVAPDRYKDIPPLRERSNNGYVKLRPLERSNSGNLSENSGENSGYVKLRLLERSNSRNLSENSGYVSAVSGAVRPIIQYGSLLRSNSTTFSTLSPDARRNSVTLSTIKPDN